MIVGTISALVLIYLSPTIQMSVLGRATAPFPLQQPGLITIPLSFAVGIVVSLLTREREASRELRRDAAPAAPRAGGRSGLSRGGISEVL